MLVSIKEIDDQFKKSWEQLSKNGRIEKKSLNKTEKAIQNLNRSLKWALAYANIRNYCGHIIKPYSPQSTLVIKRFWVHYFEQYFSKDRPPMPQDFFDWYCDSKTIHEERIILNN